MSSPEAKGQQPSGTRLIRGLPLDGLAALAVLYVLWGSTYLGIKFALQSFPPFFLGGTRFPVAGVLMLIFLRARGAPRPTRRQIAHCIIYGVLLIGLGNGMLAVAEQYVSSGIAALLVSLLAWAVGSVLARERLDLPGGGMTTAIELLSGGILQTIISGMVGEQMKPLTGQALGGWVFLLAASIIGFTAYTIVLRRLPPVLGSSFAYVNPIVAIGLGIALAGESITPLAATGVAVTLIGVVFITLAQTRKAKNAP